MVASANSLRFQFFEYLFGEETGYICIASAKGNKKDDFTQAYFEWPTKSDDLLDYIAEQATKRHIWFCTSLLEKPERKKIWCKPGKIVWADLDNCHPDLVVPPPQCALESSPGRYQGFWRLDEIVEPEIAELYSKKIAYSIDEIDKSGWDLTQLLRVPFTNNFKYGDTNPPQVTIMRALEPLISVELFEALPSPEKMPASEGDSFPMPDLSTLPEATGVEYKYLNALKLTVFTKLFSTEPEEDDDWSRLMWRLLNICIEAGMSDLETFSIAISAKCNKYHRENRPLNNLWREVLKAKTDHLKLAIIADNYEPLVLPELVSKEELAELEPTIIDKYSMWAENATDACPAYHPLNAFMLLSALTSAGLVLKTSYGELVPNLWGLVLGESTLTRKTTAMLLAINFINDIDRALVLATDGSAEGLLGGLASRPNKVSIYYRDEVAGLFESINKKDYLAGLPETLTQLYDVPPFYTRMLRKETITLVKPIFLFFGGGIQENVYALMNERYILSGFIPRFLVVNGEADLDKLRCTGPQSTTGGENRQELLSFFANLYQVYNHEVTVIIGGEKDTQQGVSDVVLTPEAWERYGKIEMEMVQAASDSAIPNLALPVFERLSRSLLKMAMLLAAARQVPDENNQITAGIQDILGAAKYIQVWGQHSVDLTMNCGHNPLQRLMDRVLAMAERDPGILRSKVMTRQRLLKREMDEIESTLIDRGQLRVEHVQSGRGKKYYSVV